MLKILSFTLALILIVLISQCSIKAPEIQVTGERTALENQVLGTYQQIESDTYIIASTRAIGSGQAGPISTQKQEVLEAMRDRKFNKDDIDELKRDKVVGENNKGFLTILPTERYHHDYEYREIVDQLVAEENKDRQIIYERVMAVNESAAKAGKDKVYEIFAKLNYDNAEPGTMVQLPDGTWIEKPEKK